LLSILRSFLSLHPARRAAGQLVLKNFLITLVIGGLARNAFISSPFRSEFRV
jgi:hypothetical protein